MPTEQQQSRVQVVVQAVTALTAVAAVLFTAQSLDYTADASRATRDQIDLSAQGQIADRFNRAIDQLGQSGPDKLSIRLGGIYSLERIMHDSPADEPTVIEVLCAFIRTNAREPVKRPKPSQIPAAPEDVRAAVTVLGRRPNPDQNSRLDLTGTQLSLPGISLAEADLRDVDLGKAILFDADLGGVNLAGADLTGADLADVDLTGADLHGADLTAVDLSGAYLADADLHGTNLTGANLRDASLGRVNLHGASLGGADLRGAGLGGANLLGASLRGADLRGAYLYSARNLTSEAVRCSRVDDQTRLPPDVTRPVDVPQEDRLSC